MSASTAERVQHFLIHIDPFAEEAYKNLRRGEIIGSRFAALSDKFPGQFATFKDPHHPANKSLLHIIIPNTQTKKPDSGTTTLFGFYEGTAQCFAITIPSKKLPDFISSAQASWQNHKETEMRGYKYLDESLMIEGIEPEDFMNALRKKVVSQPMLNNELTHQLYDTIELHSLTPPPKDGPFFGKEESIAW